LISTDRQFNSATSSSGVGYVKSYTLSRNSIDLGAPQFHCAVAESALLLHSLSLNVHPASGAFGAVEHARKNRPQTMKRHDIAPSLEIMEILFSRTAAMTALA
jgi:hypothetical protein